MQWSIEFSPLVPIWVLAVGAGLIALMLAAAWFGRMRGGGLRALAGALLVLALADPSIVRENREPLDAVVAVIVDRSASQDFGDRREMTERALAELSARLEKFSALDLRIVEAGRPDGATDGTHLFKSLTETLRDVPPERVAAAFLITDGQVHDLPARADALGFSAPVHALVSGRPEETSRRLVVVEAPRFGLVGEKQPIGFRVEDTRPDAGPVEVTIRRDGDPVETRTVVPGQPFSVDVTIPHGGANIIELEVEPRPDDLTAIDDRAVVEIEGIRENLRVLLVSGAPHPGERTWRNLLKSDASVDLVHFTILRPPEKQDGTPINQLSLIAFPTRELFQAKIDEFDLIILDRYQRRGVLPELYYDNIARYVRDGGAVLVAAGPEFAGLDTIARTRIADVLPAEPTGDIVEAPFRPKITERGTRHPVTRDLPGAGEPGWSRWFRLVDADVTAGDVVMSGAGDKPLLLLAREAEGRVAVFLSDHAWLWARGFEGGGPHVDLLRRLAHWLMKEPDLEEESLVARARGGKLTVERQTMAETAAPVRITTPSGAAVEATLSPTRPGAWRAEIDAAELGLYRVSDGERTTLVNAGPASPREFADVRSTTEVLAPLAEATGGGVFRLADAEGKALSTPRIVPIRAGGGYSGRDWAGLKRTEASVLIGIDRTPLFLGLIGLAALLGALAMTWYREGR